MPWVKIEINNTLHGDDDLAVVRRFLNLHTFLDRLPIRVTLEGASGKVRFVVTPPDRGVLSRSLLTLNNGESQIIFFTPRAEGVTVNDATITASMNGDILSEEDLTVAALVLPQGGIKNPNTPQGMRDRIPSRVDTEFDVVVEPDLTGSRQHIGLSVVNQGGPSGTVTLNGSLARIELVKTTRVALRGVTQTEPYFGGNLRLAADVFGREVGSTFGFSVSAIPVNFRQKGLAHILPVGRRISCQLEGWGLITPGILTPDFIPTSIRLGSENGFSITMLGCIRTHHGKVRMKTPR